MTEKMTCHDCNLCGNHEDGAFCELHNDFLSENRAPVCQYAEKVAENERLRNIIEDIRFAAGDGCEGINYKELKKAIEKASE